MSVRADVTGRRYVQVEAAVPAKPGKTWEAVATGAGISSWFAPTEVEERAGGTIRSRFGPDAESVATIVAWEPPRRFTAVAADLGPDAPALETEWSVEPLESGGSLVRVVQTLVTERDDWDAKLEGFEEGWRGFLLELERLLERDR